uniref:Uncharacterized protein n=1 Tax=Odontella aurita TaxID=265563 RepID=A0A6U6E5C0_9STRA|mmetsp:Transcript_23817/g.70361  ORF Transcript_23817/g.70361 Transcript_23817/m.70361 type:complete len:343 (+) Transcript_23817:294-1322(+)|eukprot:CAMPEP_0113553558 /NCGR_PEP_ID=MMETSP0015_2-20120614/15677_1 /TAXON_ID=2838 /ORGANISM="Odontella" /LENGTH=342 /DNA_ID=CAMNT_0000454635 /DNA_START=182 /DNA_END=1213 /DNA_ORIENTATION=+ /assembly_acc=CAM_ASM_000160
MFNDEPSSKRPKTELALHDAGEHDAADAPIRTSSLSHPTMKLTGHNGSVYTLSYDPQGELLCSGSFDTTCLLWSAAGDCENFNVLRGHKNAVLDVAWSHDSERVVTASADKHLAWWDVSRGERVKRFVGHEGVVNAVDVVREGAGSFPGLVASASDDCTARLWDARRRGDVGQLEHGYQVTAVAYSSDGKTVYTGGIDNCIHAWDIRRKERIMTMKGHTDTITCLSLSPKGTHLLSNSSDGTLRTWDIRPFAEGKRHRKTFEGGTHNAERGLLNCAWSADGTMVTGGSADRVVHIWDEYSTEELYYLPGHAGCVNSVVFHPKENVIASGSSDKTLYVGELAQ